MVALYLIGLIVVSATVVAFVQSYDGLYQWARRYLTDGWARTWPFQVDAWIAVGELSLYVAYRDGWSRRRTIWPWAAALTGLVASTAFNVGHMAGTDIAGHVTAAVPPVAAFAGLFLGLQVLKHVEEVAHSSAQQAVTNDAERSDTMSAAVIELNGQRSERPVSRPLRSGPGRADLQVRARRILAEQPDLTGRQLGEQLKVSERTGRRLIRHLADSGS